MGNSLIFGISYIVKKYELFKLRIMVNKLKLNKKDKL